MDTKSKTNTELPQTMGSTLKINSLIWVHAVCYRGFQYTTANNKVDDTLYHISIALVVTKHVSAVTRSRPQKAFTWKTEALKVRTDYKFTCSLYNVYISNVFILIIHRFILWDMGRALKYRDHRISGCNIQKRFYLEYCQST